jgi:chromate reductase, NAD(P)H dehydrogenase (quinone)
MVELLFIPGSLREQSTSKALTLALISRLSGACGTSIAEIGRLPHFNSDIPPDGEIEAFLKKIADADGVVIVTPEYNYSVPGVLKNAIDWASRPAMKSVFKGKPVFTISISAGALGGVRAQSHLKYILNGMLAEVYTTPEVAVPHAVAAVKDGAFANAETLDFALESLNEFLAHLAG